MTNEQKQKEVNIIRHIVAKNFKVNSADLVGSRNVRVISDARYVAVVLAMEMVNITQQDCANLFKKRSHTLSIEAGRRISDLIDTEKGFYKKVNESRNECVRWLRCYRQFCDAKKYYVKNLELETKVKEAIKSI